jgi:hypothetical protein
MWRISNSTFVKRQGPPTYRLVKVADIKMHIFQYVDHCNVYSHHHSTVFCVLRTFKIFFTLLNVPSTQFLPPVSEDKSSTVLCAKPYLFTTDRDLDPTWKLCVLPADEKNEFIQGHILVIHPWLMVQSQLCALYQLAVLWIRQYLNLNPDFRTCNREAN